MKFRKLIAALKLRKAQPEGDREYALPPLCGYGVREINNKQYLILSVPLTDTEYTVSAKGQSLVLGRLDVPAFVAKVNNENVVVGVSRGRVWIKPYSSERSLPF